MWPRRVSPPTSACWRWAASLTWTVSPWLRQELQEIGGEVVELGAAGLPAQGRLDALPEARGHALTAHRRDPALRLRADAHVGEPRRGVLCAYARRRRLGPLAGHPQSVATV